MPDSPYRLALRRLREAVDELERADEALGELADERGQTEPGVPLIVSESDTELRAAVDRELAARDAVKRAQAEVDALRPD